jgi:hypothetical protein
MYVVIQMRFDYSDVLFGGIRTRYLVLFGVIWYYSALFRRIIWYHLDGVLLFGVIRTHYHF